jgi:hypothetical protein
MNVNMSEVKKIADELRGKLDKAVLLPCKVGATVWAWSKFGNCIAEYKIGGVYITELVAQFNAYWMSYSECNEEIEFTPEDVGKTVFLARAEAEAAQKSQGWDATTPTPGAQCALDSNCGETWADVEAAQREGAKG